MKGYRGRMKFPPAMCRFKEDSIETANDKIFGRYKAPERVPGSKFTDEEHDAFEQQERLFGTGNVTKLLGRLLRWLLRWLELWLRILSGR